MFKYNFKIIYQLKIKNVKIDVFICKIDDFFITVENNKLKYQYQIILTFFRLNIHNIKIDEKTFIYEHIQSINKVDEKCECFRKIIREKKKFFNQIQLNQCFIKDDMLFH